MALPNLTSAVISGLTKGARAAYSFIRSLVAEGQKPSAIVDKLSDAGYHVRNQATYDVIAVLQNKADPARFFRTFGPNAPLPGSLHTVSATEFSDGSKYQYLVGTNSANDLIVESVYVNSAVPLSENEIFARATESFKYEESEGMRPDQIGDVFFTVDDARVIPGEIV